MLGRVKNLPGILLLFLPNRASAFFLRLLKRFLRSRLLLLPPPVDDAKKSRAITSSPSLLVCSGKRRAITLVYMYRATQNSEGENGGRPTLHFS